MVICVNLLVSMSNEKKNTAYIIIIIFPVSDYPSLYSIHMDFIIIESIDFWTGSRRKKTVIQACSLSS